MRSGLRIFFLLAAIFIFRGCVEITEDIIVNADGSGSIKVGIDVGKIGASISDQNSQIDVSMLEKIRKIPSEAPQKLNTVKGIINVQAVSDEKKGNYSLSFEFENSKALNDAIYTLAGIKKSVFSPTFIKISKHKMVKKDLSPYIRMAIKDQKKKSYNDLLFSFINYKSTCIFPADVKKASNIKSVQPDKRTVVTNFTLDEMIKGGFNFGNIIRY
jgi:hypothetical protein